MNAGERPHRRPGESQSPIDVGTDRTLRVMGLTLALIGIAVFATVGYATWWFTVDDTFIWFRYAENLSAGYGPTFNPEGPRAEGYTGFLWLWVLAIPHRLGTDPVLFAKIVGCALSTVLLAINFFFARRLSNFANPAIQWFAGGMAVFLLGSRHGLAIHSVAGMETSLYTCLLQLFFFVSVLFLDNSNRRTLFCLPFLALLVGLSRPEGVLAAGTTLGIVLLQSPRHLRFRLVWASLMLFVLPGVIYFVWRYQYYGVPLPLPFYITSLTGRGGEPGVKEFVNFAKAIGMPIGVLVLLGLYRCGQRVAASFVAVVALSLFFLFPTHRAAYFSRYFFPVLPLVMTLAGSGTAAILDFAKARIRSEARRKHAVVACSLALIALVAMLRFETLTPSSLAGEKYVLGYYSKLIRKRHIRLGKHLAAIRGEPGRRPVLAIADAGAVPYYSKWHTIDSFGLNDSHIAVTGDHDPEYILSQSPDLVVILAWQAEPLSPILPWGQDLYDACVAVGMEVIKVYGPRSYSLVVMGFPGSEIAEQLRGMKGGQSR